MGLMCWCLHFWKFRIAYRPGGSAGKESTCNAEDLAAIPGWEDPLEKGTPVFWPGEFLGLYCPWGCKESDTTERLSKEMSIHNRLKSIDSALGSEERMWVLVCGPVRIKISVGQGSSGWWIYWGSNKSAMKEEHKIKFPLMPINTKGFT